LVINLGVIRPSEAVPGAMTDLERSSMRETATAVNRSDKDILFLFIIDEIK